MANTLKFKRGLLAGLPTAAIGEPLFTTDTADLYIGTSTGNQRFQKYIASGATTQILRGDGSLYTFPLNISSPSNGQVLKYNGTAWVNDSDAGITGSGSSGQIAYFTGATTQAGNNNLFWDISNSRLGIGTNAPQYKLDVQGTSNTVAIRAASNTANDILYYGTGSVTGSSNFFLSAINATGSVIGSILNSNGSTGSAFLDINVSSTSTGDPYLSFTTSGATNWSIGIDNSDSDKLKFGPVSNPSLSGANTLVMHTTGNVSLNSLNDTGEKLQVTGTTKLGGVTTITGSSTTLLNVISTGSAAYIGMGDSSGSFTYIGSDDGSFLVQTPVNSYSTKFLINSNGSVGIGSTALSVYNLRISKTITGANPFAVWQDGTVMSTSSGSVRGFVNSLRTEAATFTVSNYAHFGVEQFALGAGSSVTTQVGFLVDSTLTGATNNYAFQGSLAAGTGRWNLFMNGSARNFLGGRLLLATTSDLGNVVSNLAITGAATISGINQLGTVQTDVSTLAVGIWNQMNLATGGTFTSYMHYRADAGTLGGSTLTNQYGYFVSGNAIGATNNYGFYGDIASGTGRWNLYMNGTGANYLNGNTGYSTTNPLTKVHIRTGNAASTLEGLRLANGSNDPGAGNRLSFYFSDGASNIAGGFVDVVKNGSDGDMLFFTSLSNGSPTEKVRFFGGGNVGIGTGSTNTGERLQVTGTMKVTGAAVFSTRVDIQGSSGGLALALPNGSWFGAAGVTNRINFDGINQLYHTSGSSGSYKFRNAADSADVLTISNTGAATFSSTVTSTQYRLSALNTAPATASSTGTLGEIIIDANHIYVCTATNTWKRVAIATF